MANDRTIFISIKSDKTSVRFDIRSSMKNGKERNYCLRSSWLKIRGKKISKILIARGRESVDLRTSLIKYLVSYFYISSRFCLLLFFFFSFFNRPFPNVFQNFSSSFYFSIWILDKLKTSFLFNKNYYY